MQCMQAVAGDQEHSCIKAFLVFNLPYESLATSFATAVAVNAKSIMPAWHILKAHTNDV